MRQRPTFIDLHDFANPVDMQRLLDRRLFVYVEGNDATFYGRLLDEQLARHVILLTPKADLDSIEDDCSGVITALDQQEKRKAKVQYLGLCDGDALSSYGLPLRLVDTTEMLVELEYDDIEANVVFLGFHDRETVLVCETDAIRQAYESAQVRGKLKPETDFDAFLHAFVENARTDLETAVKKFASSTVHYETRWERNSGEFIPEAVYNAKIELVRRQIADRIASGVAVGHRRASDFPGSLNTILSPENYELLRLCNGKKLLRRLKGASGDPELERRITKDFGKSAFADAFRAMLRRRVKATLGIELQEPNAEHPAPASELDRTVAA